MSKLPREVDDLIWRLTEDGTPAALDQFRARYPDYAKVLTDRLAMVSRLKKSNPVAKKEPTPKFRPLPRESAAPIAWSVPVILLAVAAIASASFAAYIYLPTRPAVVKAPEVPPKSVVHGFEPEKAPAVTQEGPVANNAPPVDRVVPPTNKADEVAPYEVPQDLSIRNAKLSMVLQAVAAQGKFAITVGPGLPDPIITIDYRGKNSIQILQDLGREYAFTAFDQGDGSVIVIPARDPNTASPIPSPEKDHLDTSTTKITAKGSVSG